MTCSCKVTFFMSKVDHQIEAQTVEQHQGQGFDSQGEKNDKMSTVLYI